MHFFTHLLSISPCTFNFKYRAANIYSVISPCTGIVVDIDTRGKIQMSSLLQPASSPNWLSSQSSSSGLIVKRTIRVDIPVENYPNVLVKFHTNFLRDLYFFEG